MVLYAHAHTSGDTAHEGLPIDTSNTDNATLTAHVTYFPDGIDGVQPTNGDPRSVSVDLCWDPTCTELSKQGCDDRVNRLERAIRHKVQTRTQHWWSPDEVVDFLENIAVPEALAETYGQDVSSCRSLCVGDVEVADGNVSELDQTLEERHFKYKIDLSQQQMLSEWLQSLQLE